MDVQADGLSVSVCFFLHIFFPPPVYSMSGPLQPCNYNGTGMSVHISSAAFTITSNNPKA